MPITGGMKYFKRSKSLLADGATMIGSTGVGAEDNALDKNRFSFWRSVGSSDSTTETLTLSLPSSQTIDRLFLVDHNWKDFSVTYGSTPTAFTSVVGIDGALGGGIVETAFADDTAYYEFDAVTTDTINIEVTKTQVADQEKYLNQIIVTEELGTLEGFPVIRSVRRSRNERTKKMLSGRVLVQKSEETMSVRLGFKNYPASLASDITLMTETLFDIEDDFLVWLCGGRRGSTYFKNQMAGFKLRDVLSVQYGADLAQTYSKNVFQNTVNFNVSLLEHV